MHPKHSFDGLLAAGRPSAGLVLALAACGSATAPPPPATGAAPGVPPFTVLGRWPDASALRYRVDEEGGPLAPGALRRAVEDALRAWTSEGVGFVEAAEGEEPDLLLRWASDDEADRRFRDTSVAVTGPPGPGCTVRFRRNARWEEQDGPSLRRTAVHELGHVLGLGHLEDASSALHPQRQIARAEPGRGDRAGLRSLYGAPGGPAGPADLLVTAGGEPRAALRDVAPPDGADWTLFDTDGDGDDEVLVWATGAEHHGALTIHHFERGPRLARTVGPLLGVGGPGVRVAAARLPDEGRLLVTVRPGGEPLARRFDEDGRPGLPRAAGGAVAEILDAARGEPERRARGDLDGDGREERVARPRAD